MSTPLQTLSKAISENPQVVTPFGNYCLVELFVPSDKSAGGVALPDEVKAKANRVLGRVIRVGSGLRSNWTGEFLPMFVKEGDLVLITRHAATEIRLETGETMRVVAEGDIIGKVDETELQKYLPEGFNLKELTQDEPTPEAKEEGVEDYGGATVSQSPGGIFVVQSE